jgi:hypothetical protein
VIHVVTSKNTPNYEIELNEAWVLAKDAYGDTANAVYGDVSSTETRYKTPQGRVVAKWNVITVPDGRTLLNGAQIFNYLNGKPMWTVEFDAGRKTGQERYLRADGTPVWEKEYASDGTWTWKSFDRDGKLVATSNWKGKTLLSSDVPDPPVRKKSSDAKPQEPDAE